MYFLKIIRDVLRYKWQRDSNQTRFYVTIIPELALKISREIIIIVFNLLLMSRL